MISYVKYPNFPGNTPGPRGGRGDPLSHSITHSTRGASIPRIGHRSSARPSNVEHKSALMSAESQLLIQLHVMKMKFCDVFSDNTVRVICGNALQ